MISRFLAAVLLSASFVSASLADGTGRINTGEPTRPLDAKSFGQLIRILTANPEIDGDLPPICDSLGFVWLLTKSGNSITGSADFGCGGVWPVTGGNDRTTVSLFADGRGINACYCNDAVDMTGIVDVGSRTFEGTHTQLHGCAGSVPVTAGLCQ